MAGMELVHALGTGATGELAARITTQREALFGQRDAMLAQFDAIDAALERAGLAPPTRPDSYPQYMQWANGIMQSLGTVVTATMADGAMAALGRCAGDLLQSVELHITVLDLLEVAPSQERLQAHDQQIGAQRASLVQALAAQARGAALPAWARPQAEKLAAIGGVVVALDDRIGVAKRTAVLRLAFQQLAGELGVLRMSMAAGAASPVTVTAADAFELTLLATEIGTPMGGMQLLTSLGTADGELAVRIAAQQGAYAALGPAVGAKIVDVEARLQRSRLPVPARPNTYAEYLQWSDAVAFAVAGTAGPERPEGALSALGRAVAEVASSMALLVVVTRLREVASDHAGLRAQDERLAQILPREVERLEGMAKFSSLPAAARPDAERCAVIARLGLGILDTAPAVRAAGLELTGRKLGETVGALRSALAPN